MRSTCLPTVYALVAGHQMLVSVGWGPCTVMSNASWVMVTWDYLPLPPWTDKHDWKHYHPTTSLAGSNNFIKGIKKPSLVWARPFPVVVNQWWLSDYCRKNWLVATSHEWWTWGKSLKPKTMTFWETYCIWNFCKLDEFLWRNCGKKPCFGTPFPRNWHPHHKLWSQWRIQDFPPSWERQAYYFGQFFPKPTWNWKKIFDQKGARP